MANGIHYFLGNVPGHVTHALPLYRRLGGTFVVLSESARQELATYGLDALVIDERPDEFLRLSGRIGATIDYLEEHASVVLFYEMFLFPRRLRATRFEKIFLWHGNFLKPFLTMNRLRKRAVKQYDHIAALGPHNRQRMLDSGRVRADQLVDIGIARTDEVSSLRGRVEYPQSVLDLIGGNATTQIVSYVPTYWGVSTVESIGKDLVRYFPDDRYLIVRPHPQTPQRILDDYAELACDRWNVVLATPRNGTDVSLLDLFLASSLIIGDVSSVMLEAILLDKPLLFARDPDGRDVADLAPIRDLVQFAGQITAENVAGLRDLIDTAVNTGIRQDVWRRSKNTMFFDHEGTSVERIAEFVTSRAERSSVD